MNPALVGLGIQLGSTALGKLFGGDKKTEAAVPDDLKGMRAQQIGLLNFLLGMGPDPRTQMQGQAQQQVAQAQQAMPDIAKVAGMKGAAGKFGKRMQNELQSKLPMIQAQAAQSWAPQPWASQQTPQQAAFTPFGRRMAEGGMVAGPGGPTDDMVPAMLSNGEGVLNTGAVQQVGGPEIIHLLNMLGMTQNMANGGIAGQPMVEPEQSRLQQLQGQGAMGMAATMGRGFDMSGTMPQMPQPQQGTTQWGGQMPVTMANPMPNLPDINMGGTGGGQVPTQGGGMQTPQQRLESFYGPLGAQQSPLQQQGSQAFSYLLNQPTPEQRAAEISLPQLQQNLTGNASTQGAINGLMGLQNGAGADVEGRLGQIGQRPITGTSSMDGILQWLASGQGGQGSFSPSNVGIAELQQLAGQNSGVGVMNALDPMFQRSLAAANQQGGRFGTSNALLRGQALENNQMLAAKAMLEGAGIQTQAASALGNTGVGYDALRQRGQEAGQQNQLGALNAMITGVNNRDTSALQANQILGNQRLTGQAQTGQNLNNAGQLGSQQGQLGNNAANILASILGGQGAAERQLAGQAFGAGAVESGQLQAAQNQVTQLLNQLLGTSQSATLGGPVTQTPSGAQQGADLGAQLAQLYLMNQGGKTGGTA